MIKDSVKFRAGLNPQGLQFSAWQVRADFRKFEQKALDAVLINPRKDAISCHGDDNGNPFYLKAGPPILSCERVFRHISESIPLRLHDVSGQQDRHNHGHHRTERRHAGVS